MDIASILPELLWGFTVGLGLEPPCIPQRISDARPYDVYDRRYTLGLIATLGSALLFFAVVCATT
jgi:hypothetical protein